MTVLLVGAAMSPACRALPPETLPSEGADAEVAADAAAAAADADAAQSADGAAIDGAGAAKDAGALVLPSLDGPCSPGAARCAGVELDTCAPAGDGWVRTTCFPGTFCQQGACVPIGSNLIIVFDTSGSMASQVPGRACGQQGFGNCDPSVGCTRMDVSKTVFSTILKQLDPLRVALALFRFPTRIARTVATGCTEGFVVGTFELAGDTGAQSVAANAPWFWGFLHEVLAVPFPTTTAAAKATPAAMAVWIDGKESVLPNGVVCQGPSVGCSSSLACSPGACCGNECRVPVDPELRATGGTPIGKTLFYVGEYLRHRVVVDGRPCKASADCGTPHHHCLGGVCVDPARACRDTVIVLFTDGSQDNDPADFFSPLPMAKRLAFGLACAGDSDCAGGALCKLGRCGPVNPGQKRCMATGAPCLPGAPLGDPLHCPKLGAVDATCIDDPVYDQVAVAKKAENNVLRAPDGTPFSARLQVVDVSGAATVALSFALASAGGGRVLTADTADPAALLAVLTQAFDLKNKKVCSNTF